MPSLWIGHKINDFKEFDVSASIAALKIYITFTLFSKTNNDGIGEIYMTFSEISEKSSLSRSLVNNGLKVLYEMELIKNISKTSRKKIYTIDIDGFCKDGWCKLPYSGVVNDFGLIPAFKAMHNRYGFELLAMRMYLYLLYARDNKSEKTLARLSTISKKLDTNTPDINKAITYLIAIGLLEKIEKKPSQKEHLHLFYDSYHFFFKTGSEYALTYKDYKNQPISSVSETEFIDF